MIDFIGAGRGGEPPRPKAGGFEDAAVVFVLNDLMLI